MRNAALKILAYFSTFVILFILQKPVFVAVYASLIGPEAWGSLWQVIANGFSMDCAMAGYFTIIPALLVIARLWTDSRALTVMDRIYAAFAALLISAVFCLDIALYGYWGFRLDTTPLFYFSTSPAAALASAGAGLIAGGFAAMAALAFIIYLILTRLPGRIPVARLRSAGATAVAVLLAAALFIPIRGGFTVSTMNLSRAYFSQNQRLNHAAINPMFSLMYSATHQSDFASQFRFMDAAEADSVIEQLTDTSTYRPDSVPPLLTVSRPDIVMIILESFSSHLMPSLGGTPVAVGLDSVAAGGLLFTNFYANSFRTDRALTSILSAYPAQPTTSVMKYVEKMENLPSLSLTLRRNGYIPSYFYGGDANFTNMLAYLVHSGFENIVSDKDFPISEKTGKWGAHDHLVFRRAESAILSAPVGAAPRFDVIQTSSSHEPFEVPYSNPAILRLGAAANAFAYTDSCLTAFVNRLKASPKWKNTLVIIVPDHYGAWPADIDDPIARHTIPLVMTGGALARPGERVGTPGCQTDIAATLLASLGIPYGEFRFSKDMLNPSSPHFAVFTRPDLIGFVSESDTAVVSLDTGKPLIPSSPAAERSAKAYLQKLYDNLSAL